MIADKGFQGLAFWHNGMKQFSGPDPLRMPEDARGLKFRIMESDVLQAQVQAIGGNPQKMALGEVYQALQTGAIDAQENTWSNIYGKKFFEVQNGITETNHGVIDYLLVTSSEWWNSLDTGTRERLQAIIDEVTEERNLESHRINPVSYTHLTLPTKA